ncbi:hypothetical protein [Roseateles violae]|uniref:Uncharacterized protein n=1 Tax=Roseateles violae TaxID=3058042 RepID=A0ABT8DYJ8_9BURK|nr:hypothetical protein [Pelomonas sp. PFR6]MDN3922649.1 hypothetical protein [Pelomonas sp. PFR6]
MPTFTGKTTTYTDRNGNFGPYVNEISFEASFDAQGRWTIEPSDFSGHAPTDANNVSELAVTLKSRAEGQSSRTAKTAAVKVVFSIVTQEGVHASLDLSFDTAASFLVPAGPDKNKTLKGLPLDTASGQITMVGKGKLKAAFGLVSAKSGVLLSGKFTPNPWA